MSVAELESEPTALGGVMDDMYEQLFPTTVPAETSMSLQDVATEGDGDAPTDMILRAVIGAIGAQGGAGSNAWASEMAEDFQEILGSETMPFVDTSEVSTTEALNDNILEKSIACIPWNGAQEQQFTEYMPLFCLETEARNRSPGFHAGATHVLINQMQAQRAQEERNAKLAVEMGKLGVAASSDGWRKLLPLTDPNKKARRIIGGFTPHNPTRQVNNDNDVPLTAEEERLNTLKWYTGTEPEELFKKISFLGPITAIWDGNGPKPRPAHSLRGTGRPNERMFNYAFHNRGTIQQVFGPGKLVPGTELYVKVGIFSKSQMQALAAENGISATVGSKRVYDDESSYSNFIGAPVISVQASDQDAFTQLHFFNSLYGHSWMSDTSAPGFPPEAADVMCMQAERKVAREFRDYEVDEVTNTMREVNKGEGLQEAINNLPSVILEHCKLPGCIKKIGTVRSQLNKAVSEEEHINAHYSHEVLAALPHISVQLNR